MTRLALIAVSLFAFTQAQQADEDKLKRTFTQYKPVTLNENAGVNVDDIPYETMEWDGRNDFIARDAVATAAAPNSILKDYLAKVEQNFKTTLDLKDKKKFVDNLHKFINGKATLDQVCEAFGKKDECKKQLLKPIGNVRKHKRILNTYSKLKPDVKDATFLLESMIVFNAPSRVVTTTTTRPGSKTTTTVPRSKTTTTIPKNCCSPLVQKSTSSSFKQGNLTFAYGNGPCKEAVVATCVDPSKNLHAGIVVNGKTVMNQAIGKTTSPGSCVRGVWQMGSSKVQIATIECRLSNSTIFT